MPKQKRPSENRAKPSPGTMEAALAAQSRPYPCLSMLLASREPLPEPSEKKSSLSTEPPLEE
jgi:hypothetical protein